MTAPPKLLSLVFVLDPPARRVLLGLKKRGFGAGKFNGFGGKLEAGETMAECASRELSEESGLLVPPDALEARGRMCFDMCGKSGMLDKATGLLATRLLVHVFSAALDDVESGTIFESDEMRPEWFSYDSVPLPDMWLDDKYWLPRLLEGEDVVGAFVFEDQATIKSHEVRPLPRGAYTADPGSHDFALLDAPPIATPIGDKENQGNDV